MKNNTVCARTAYTDFKHEAWIAALNILAVEFLVKTNQPEKYQHYRDELDSLSDDNLTIMHAYFDMGNGHTTSLGHMLSHGDYDSLKETLFDLLDKGLENC